MTGNAQAIAQLFATDTAGRNLPSYPEIYPEAQAPVIVVREGARRLETMQWGWPPFGTIRRPITNVRNLTSPFWRNALSDPAQRCLVPATAFSEWSQTADPLTGRKRKHWFALHGTRTDDQPLFAFAGLWRATDEGPRFAFLTCDANPLVGAIHPKAMPVILRPGPETDRWLSADGVGAAALQRPLTDALMREIDPAASTPAPIPVQASLF